VKSLIDGGTCGRVATGCNCGDDARGFYHAFEYKGNTVVVVSGAPNHAAEHDPPRKNPNSRCERWQYAVLPGRESRTLVSSGSKRFGMGTTGWVKSGAVLFDERSSPDGNLAAFYEYESLDSCHGHSAPPATYHYHASPACIAGAEDEKACVQLGFMMDGFPVYGECNDASGSPLLNCWRQTQGTEGDNIRDYYYDEEAFKKGECGLDMCSGATNSSGGYNYYTSANFPYVPICYWGTRLGQYCGFIP